MRKNQAEMGLSNLDQEGKKTGLNKPVSVNSNKDVSNHLVVKAFRVFSWLVAIAIIPVTKKKRGMKKYVVSISTECDKYSMVPRKSKRTLMILKAITERKVLFSLLPTAIQKQLFFFINNFVIERISQV